MTKLKAPYVWFGGKSRIAPIIWERLGDVDRYIEPFAGSIATLLARPDHHVKRDEIINDLDGFVPKFWRAVQADATKVVEYATIPLFECELHSRNIWLESRRSELAAKLEGDPDYYDPKIAGWWVWVLGETITGIFGNKGPWVVKDGALIRGEPQSGIKRSIPQLSHGHLHGYPSIQDPPKIFAELQDRMKNVRVLCGDWERCVKPSVTNYAKTVGILLDPPYGATGDGDYDTAVYAGGVDLSLAASVRATALELGSNPRFRIALCGYEGEHNELEDHGWTKQGWKTSGGMARLGNGDTRGVENADKERVWFSPHCIAPDEVATLF